MAQQTHPRHTPGATMAPHEIPRLNERETVRQRAAMRARDTGNLLLAWSIPLILTAVIFAAVIVGFWWAA